MSLQWNDKEQRENDDKEKNILSEVDGRNILTERERERVRFHEWEWEKKKENDRDRRSNSSWVRGERKRMC